LLLLLQRLLAMGLRQRPSPPPLSEVNSFSLPAQTSVWIHHVM